MSTEQAPGQRKHNHYFKPCPYDEIDVYRLLELFQVTDQSIGHAVKKLLVAGGRGAGKNIDKDIAEAIDTLQRWQEMRREDLSVLIYAEPAPAKPSPPAPAFKLYNDGQIREVKTEGDSAIGICEGRQVFINSVLFHKETGRPLLAFPIANVDMFFTEYTWTKRVAIPEPSHVVNNPAPRTGWAKWTIPAEELQIESVPNHPSAFGTSSKAFIKASHIPTGISYTCTDGRSQHANRAKAIEQLTFHVADYLKALDRIKFLSDMSEQDKRDAIDKLKEHYGVIN
jgi:hypothetical protein